MIPRCAPIFSNAHLSLSVLGRKFDDVFHGRDAHATWHGRPARGLNTSEYLWRSILRKGAFRLGLPAAGIGSVDMLNLRDEFGNIPDGAGNG